MEIKINIRKAYDTINWQFVIGVPRAFGFSTRFYNWIVNIFHSAKLSVLINGTPGGFFNCGSGVRQGDPLSLPFFGIAEDFLSYLIQQKANEGYLTLIIPVPLIFSLQMMFFFFAGLPIKTSSALRYLYALW